MKSTPQDIRKDIFKMMHYSKSSHIGSALSIVEILYAFYFNVTEIDKIKRHDIDRDVFILSKGHASAALYATLAHAEVIEKSELEKYYIDDGILPGHLDMTKACGIECAAGSLGHGAGIGLGIALGKTVQKHDGHIFVLLGDGECNEGSVWEAIMLASTLKQKNYTLIIDFNHLQGMGADVIEQNNLKDRLTAFGFYAVEVDGHNIDQLVYEMKEQTRPKAIIAKTIKGYNVSFTKNKLEWHYKSPNDQELTTALLELDSK